MTSHYPLIGIVLLAARFGSTNVVFPGTVAGSTGVSNDEQGVAGALVNAARQMGAAIGVAVVLSVVALDAGAPPPAPSAPRRASSPVRSTQSGGEPQAEAVSTRGLTAHPVTASG